MPRSIAEASEARTGCEVSTIRAITMRFVAAAMSATKTASIEAPSPGANSRSIR
jgi:hypothetical protein